MCITMWTSVVSGNLPALQAHVLFLKPVQTGFPDDCDSRLLVSATVAVLRAAGLSRALSSVLLNRRIKRQTCLDVRTRNKGRVCWQQAAVLGIAPTYGPHAARLAHIDARGQTLPGGYSPDSDTEADEAR